MTRSFLIIGLILLVVAVFTTLSCEQDKSAAASAETITVKEPNVPDWHKNANIYEVNLRHFTPEGTFSAFAGHLPRLKQMGVDILWLMPIHPVSLAKRKGELGSPYAVGDYKAVNPDYGTMEDFKMLLDSIHALGMYCIIDWVPNHTGWDNPWITDHPDWYSQDKDGNIIDPINQETGESWGWTDVADLNYDVPEMRLGMIDAMRFWTQEIGIDGFRVDVAHSVPLDFWSQCTDSLYSDGPLFMLAEAEIPEFRNIGAFTMDYGWEMHHLLNEIARSQGANRGAAAKLQQGNLVEADEKEMEKKTALDIDAMLAKKAGVYEKGFSMHFTSNHDENSWAGTEFERMGDGHKAFAVLTATFDGMPLIYTGMESAMDKRLEFFTKDEVPWGEYEYANFYRTLFNLKHVNQALWNGEYGGELVKIPTGNDENVYAFMREKNRDRVVVVINLSAEPQTYILAGDHHLGVYGNAFAPADGYTQIGSEFGGELGPWEYLVFHRE